jgi:predicted Zn-ribbon and HTH transcriptional regulator
MPIRRCPICNSKNVARSRRRGVLDFLVLPLLLLRPFRCQSCDNRYYGLFLSKRRVSRQLVRT